MRCSRLLIGSTEQMGPPLGDELAHDKKVWRVLADWVLVVGLVVAFGSLFYFTSLAARLVGVVVLIYCATQLAGRVRVHEIPLRE